MKKSATQRVAEELTSWIASGRYRPGDYLPSEGDLARQFAVSKPTVRESMRQLVAFGAIEVTHGKPAMVKAVNSTPLVNFFHLAVSSGADGLREAIELRRALEAQSVLLATSRATLEELQGLERIVGRMDSCKDNYDLWVGEHVRFHLALVNAAHNRFFSFLVDALRETVVKTNRMIIAAQPKRNPELTFARHVAIFDAVTSRDLDLARTAVDSHFDAVDNVLAKFFTAMNARPGEFAQ